MGRRKVVRFQAVSKSSDVSHSLDPQEESAGDGPRHLSEYGRDFRYEYAYESTWVEICSTDTRADQDRRTDVLLQAVGADLAQQFDWVAETDTIQTYEHRLTLRYLHIDSMTGEFCDQQRTPTSRERALAYALGSPESSTYELITTSFIFELPLGAFLRRGRFGREDDGASGSSSSESGAATPVGWIHGLVQAYRRVWGKLRADRDAEGEGSAARERFRFEGEPHSVSERGELSLAAYTRRAA